MCQAQEADWRVRFPFWTTYFASQLQHNSQFSQQWQLNTPVSYWRAAFCQIFSTWKSQWSCAHFCIFWTIMRKGSWEGGEWVLLSTSSSKGLELLSFRKSQQYDCKWYIPLTDLSFQMVDGLRQCPTSHWCLMRSWMPWRSRYPRSRMTSSVKR